MPQTARVEVVAASVVLGLICSAQSARGCWLSETRLRRPDYGTTDSAEARRRPMTPHDYKAHLQKERRSRRIPSRGTLCQESGLRKGQA